MATLGTYYYDGTSFALASGLFTDATLLTPAPDGYYSQGGLVRQVAGGILGAPITCQSCTYACNASPVSDNVNAFGQYTLDVDLGNTTGAVLVEFTPGTNTAVRCTWTYDGLNASEYSSPNFGYCQGVIGDENCCGITNAAGSGGSNYTGTAFQYQGGLWQSSGVSTWGPYATQAAGGVDLAPGGGYGTTIMVIPKPNASPTTATFVIDMPSIGDHFFTLKVNCASNLPSFTGDSVSAADCVSVCANTANPTTFYHAPVSGTSGIPAVNDWVFTDINGITAVANGYWRVDIGGISQCMEVQDGVIINLTAC